MYNRRSTAWLIISKLLSERERLEREKYILQLENSILRLERRLPTGRPPKGPN